MTEIQKVEPSPLMLINLALDKGLDIEKLTSLFNLQERWEKKESEKLFFQSFAKFQSELPEIKKKKQVNYPTKTGGTIKYNYAPLSDIIEQIKKPLSLNGLSYRWEFAEKNGLIECTCFVSHLGGHTKQCVFSAPKDDSGQKNAIQQIGSTHTYLQRYTLIGCLGIASADEDNDGKNQQNKPESVNLNQFSIEEFEVHKSKIDLLKTTKEFSDQKENILSSAREKNVNVKELKLYFAKKFNSISITEKKSDIKSLDKAGLTVKAELP